MRFLKTLFKRLFCKHKEWLIQPSYAELYYDRCKECGKYRETIGEIKTMFFKLGTFKIK